MQRNRRPSPPTLNTERLDDERRMRGSTGELTPVRSCSKRRLLPYLVSLQCADGYIVAVLRTDGRVVLVGSELLAKHLGPHTVVA